MNIDLGVSLEPLEIQMDTYLLAKMLKSECHSCSIEEKESLAYVPLKRANSNYGGYGRTLVAQIFKKNQFQGINKGRFTFDECEPLDVENLSVAQSILNGKIPEITCEGCFSFARKDVDTQGYNSFSKKNFKHNIIER